MTGRQKADALEQKAQIYHERRGRCEVCDKLIPFGEAQLAHRIPMTKKYIKEYGKPFIHSKDNLALVCSLKCNSAVLLDPKTHPMEAEELFYRWKENRS